MTESSETQTAIWQGGIVVENDTRGGGQGGVAVVTGCPRPFAVSVSERLRVRIACGPVAADVEPAWNHWILIRYGVM